MVDGNEEPMKREIENLVKLANDRSSEGRAELYTGIAEVLNDSDEPLTSGEINLMCDIMRRITHEVEMAIRIKMANSLADREDISYDLIKLLANDDIQVAFPVLCNSGLLQNEDLIEIIRNKTLKHQLAISVRHEVDASVSHALAETGKAEVIVSLLSNTGSRIDNDTYGMLVDYSRENEIVQKPLLERRDLPAEMAALMYEFVSDALKEFINANFDIDEDQLEKALQEAIAELNEESQNWEAEERAADIALIDKLAEAGALKRSFLVKALNHGNNRQFELAFARMLGLEETAAKKLIYESGTENLALACLSVSLDRGVFPTIFRLTRFAKRMETNLSEQDKDVISQVYNGYSAASARDEIEKRSSNFQ